MQFKKKGKLLERFLQPCVPAALVTLFTIWASGCQGKNPSWVEGWQATASLNGPRSGFAVARAGDFIYVAGGVDGRRYVKTTEFSRIGADGRLSAWRQGPPLNEARGFFAMAAHNGFIYAVGGGQGKNGEQLLKSIERARILDDGSLDRWQPLPQTLNIPRRCARLVVQGEHLLAIGGFGGTSLNTVEQSRMGKNGNLGPWKLQDRPLTMPRYVHATAQNSDYAFILGGHEQKKGTGSEKVAWKSLHAKQPWRPSQSLGEGRYALSAAMHGDRIYAMGGISGVRFFDTVETARFTGNALSDWRTTTALPRPMAEFGTAVHHDRIYVIGGTYADGYTGEVFYASFNNDGDIGFHGKASQAVSRRDAPRQQPLPYQGRIVSIEKADPYVYLELQAENRRWWIATQGESFQKGAVVQHGKGVQMQDFYSKSLQRRFPVVIFTARVRVLP